MGKMQKHIRLFVERLGVDHNKKFVVVQLKSGHYLLRDAETGKAVATIPNSPSDHRWELNARSQVRRSLAS
jgi:hypothetical protein